MLNIFDSLKSNVKNMTSFEQAQQMGVPHLKDELWKYTRAKKFLSDAYSVYDDSFVASKAKHLVEGLVDANVAVFQW